MKCSRPSVSTSLNEVTVVRDHVFCMSFVCHLKSHKHRDKTYHLTLPRLATTPATSNLNIHTHTEPNAQYPQISPPVTNKTHTHTIADPNQATSSPNQIQKIAKGHPGIS